MTGSKWPTAYPDTMVTTNRVVVYNNFEYLVNLEERFGKHKHTLWRKKNEYEDNIHTNFRKI
jgi:hypothetical protein